MLHHMTWYLKWDRSKYNPIHPKTPCCNFGTVSCHDTSFYERMASWHSSLSAPSHLLCLKLPCPLYSIIFNTPVLSYIHHLLYPHLNLSPPLYTNSFLISILLFYTTIELLLLITAVSTLTGWQWVRCPSRATVPLLRKQPRHLK